MMHAHETSRAVLGIVPARGGSKGIPRKNIRVLAGTPLLVYTARAALKAASLSRILLSTDDPEISAVGRSAGLEAPFVRPAELSLDSTPMVQVVLHAITWTQASGLDYQAICVLQPTSPLRSPAMIDRCVSLLWERDVDSVISVRPVPPEFNPHWTYFESSEGLLEPCIGGAEITRRQELPPAYHPDGSVFVVKTEVVLREHSLRGKRVLAAVSPENEAADLDTEEQWRDLAKRLKSAPKPTD